jgi:hypothetical protein
MTVAFEADPVATAVARHMNSAPLVSGGVREWIGSATALLKLLNADASAQTQRTRTWPKAPNALAKYLKSRAAPALRTAGITVSDNREGHAGDRKLVLQQAVSSVSTPPAVPPQAQTAAYSADSTRPHQPSVTVSPSRNRQPPVPAQATDTLGEVGPADDADDADESEREEVL